MSEMSERIAKTMWEHWFCTDWPPTHAADLSMDAENFREVAQKVLAAMREPTNEMVSCLVAYEGADGWRDAIDTALQE